jgi:uncharacterized protein
MSLGAPRRLLAEATSPRSSHMTLARDRTGGAAVAMLAISNVVTNRQLPPAAYVPWNLGMAGLLVSLARRSGCTTADLGLDSRHLRRSLTVGEAGAGIVASAYAFVLLTQIGKEMLHDERATSADSSTARWVLLTRIPLGTVLAEEVMFRGVLPALFTSSTGPNWLSGTVSSLMFGLWHVLPARELVRANKDAGRFLGAAPAGRAVGLAVMIATLAGGVLHFLRRRTGHLAAPVAVHLAVNEFGYVAARATREPARSSPTQPLTPDTSLKRGGT